MGDESGGTQQEPISRVDYVFQIQGGPGASWQVRRFRVSQGLSQTYALVVDVLTEDHVEPTELLGLDACLDLDRQDVLRSIAGVIERVDYIGRNLDRKLVLRLHIVPALQLLSQQVGCRIFQDRTVPEILDEVLSEGLGTFGREFDLSALATDAATYPKRDYCVQFRESTLDFVSRLMEEDGITYYFRGTDDKEQLFLVDQSGDPNAAFPDVELIDPDGEGVVPIISANNFETINRESLRMFDWCQPLRPNEVVVRSFNWKAFDPENGLEAPAAGEAIAGARRQYVFTEQRKAVDEGSAEATSGFDGTSSDEMGNEARRRFERFQSETQLGRGRSNVVGFAPGLRFKADDRSLPPMDDSVFVLTSVSCEGANPGIERSGDSNDSPTFENTFECIPTANAYRPRRITPTPKILGPQTATVTGDSGEEIHTDVHGRIKVRFHWDEHSALDASSSCWVRVLQTWAGPGWGSMFLPRVGMEVVVEFLDGNPDRPLVTGCVYNSANPPPYPLPDEKTKSTIKSESSPGGDGFNELRFEDAAGVEEIYVHAQKDYNEEVLNDHNTTVGHDQTNTVDNDQTNTIHNNQTEVVDVDQDMTVGGNRTVHVKGDFEETVDGTETRTVTGDVTETFAANETRDITGDQTETITGSVSHTITGDQTDTITGSLDQTVTAGVTLTTPATYDVTAVGGITMTAAAGITMVAPGGFTILAPGGTKTVDKDFWQFGGGKGAIFGFTIGITASKVDMVGVAIANTGTKLEHKGMSISATMAEAKLVETAKIETVGQAIMQGYVNLHTFGLVSIL